MTARWLPDVRLQQEAGELGRSPKRAVVSRAVAGGWSRFPEELATARGQIGGFVTGAGAGFAVAGEHGTATVIALIVMVVGFVLTMRAWSKAEAHRENYRAAPSDGDDSQSAPPSAPERSA